MNRRFTFRSTTPRVSRFLILLGFTGAVSLVACQEKLEAGAGRPGTCPQRDVQLKDPITDAIAVDSSVPGFPVIGEEQPLLLAARGDTLDTRVIFRFDTIGKTYAHPSAP